ncbi:YadA-like family protein [Burkholderia sp. BKH01]|nr:YadA-like family protein [Burkholderia sp. BKH01]MCU9953989.1 YadA-like family protein [Burkholderia sp. BKH01]
MSTELIAIGNGAGQNVSASIAAGGNAAAMALTVIPEVDEDKTTVAGVAGGTYRGTQAVAFGATLALRRTSSSARASARVARG